MSLSLSFFFTFFQVHHGSVSSVEHHVGDFGNIEANEDGNALIDLIVSHAAIVDGPTEESKLKNIVGKSIVIHQGEDDLGNLRR